MIIKRRIPNKNGDFDQYIRNTTAWLFADSPQQTGLFIPAPWPPPVPPPAAAVPDGAVLAIPALKNWQRLWLLGEEASSWYNHNSKWGIVYPKYSNPDTRTRVVTKDKDAEMESFTLFAEPMLNRMASSPYITNEDRAIFRIKQRDGSSTRHRTSIQDFPEFSMHAMGGGDIKFSVRSTHDAERASKIEGTQIEVRYQVLTVDEPRPTNPDDMTRQYLSTKAIFTLHTGAGSTGKILWAAVRWYVVNDPSRSGPWSSIQNIGIS